MEEESTLREETSAGGTISVELLKFVRWRD